MSTTANRAYSILHVKSVDSDRRVITGVATTPSMDRVGDIVDPLGAKFAADLPLLLFHDHKMPVGRVRLGKATKDGIGFEAQIPEIDEPGTLKSRVDEAWQSVKAGLIKGVSIGFRAAEDGIEMLKSGGLRFTNFEILELSLVPIPANADATILAIKAIDAAHLALSGNGAGTHTTAVSGIHATARKGARHMKTIPEQIKDNEATRQAKSALMAELMNKAAEEGRTLDAQESEDYDAAEGEVKKIDQHLSRLASLEKAQQVVARPVNGTSVEKAAESRDSQRPAFVSVRDNMPEGIAFARAVACQIQGRMDGFSPLEVAKARYPDHQALHQFLQFKAVVPAGTSTQAVYAGPLVYAQNLSSEFVDFLRPQTIVGKLPLNRAPFNSRVPVQTSGGHAAWVPEGGGKPVTSVAYTSVSVGYHKLATIAVLTKELIRFSTPSAEMLIRNTLAGAIIQELDNSFIDPAFAAVAGTNPASITNGLVALTPSGTTADNARTDLANIIEAYLSANDNPTGLHLIMPPTLAVVLGLMRNSLGQKEFPDINAMGGTLEGFPVITSQLAANSSGYGNLVIALKPDQIFLADDGGVTIDASDQASLQMSDAPTINATTGAGASLTSLWQTNSVGIRAEREITWTKARSTAVVYMDDVNWGSVGSPA